MKKLNKAEAKKIVGGDFCGVFTPCSGELGQDKRDGTNNSGKNSNAK